MDVSTQLDLIRGRLFDSSVLWTDAELLQWWNDAYMGFLGDSGAVRRPLIEDVPGRMAFAHSYEWETSYLKGTTYRFTGLCLGATRAATSLWEVEHLEGITPTTSRAGSCQPWERCYLTDTDAAFQFMLPREHEKTARVTWDDRLLVPVAVKQLDWLRGWTREPGQPIVWTAGTGRERTFELFEIRTDYQQAYELLDAHRGGPREVLTSTASRIFLQRAITPAVNAWAYTNGGDRDALVGPDNRFAPTSAVTQDWEIDYAPGDAPYRFLLYPPTDSPVAPQLPYSGTEPFEILSPECARTLGTFPWEGQFDAIPPFTVILIPGDCFTLGITITNYEDIRPRMKGVGILVTLPAADPSKGFCTQEWEVEQLDGVTTPSFTGERRGTFYGEASDPNVSALVPTLYMGTIRGISSPDRQYFPIQDAAQGTYTGIPRAWRTSSLSVTVDELFVPPRSLDAGETPGLVPSQTLKYLRYYVLGKCFGRQGEGANPVLGAHYSDRYTVGMRHFQRLRDLAYRDRDWQRQPTGMLTARPGRVRFPSNFPRVNV